MSRHTDKPWGISVDLDGGISGKPDTFCPVGGCGCCGSPWVNGDTPEEQQANGRLMEMAPRLLKALRRYHADASVGEVNAFQVGVGEAWREAEQLLKEIDLR